MKRQTYTPEMKERAVRMLTYAVKSVDIDLGDFIYAA